MLRLMARRRVTVLMARCDLILVGIKAWEVTKASADIIPLIDSLSLSVYTLEALDIFTTL